MVIALTVVIFGGVRCFVGVLAMVVVMITMAKVIFALDLKITRVRSLQP